MNWTPRIEKAEKFLQKTISRGRTIYQRYEDEREDATQSSQKRINLFYANVNTLKESLFNSLPKPDVSRMQRGAYNDDVSRVAALIIQRGLDYEVKTAKDVKDSVEAAILERLVPGFGQVWIRFADEQIFVERVYWEDFIWEPARSWNDVGWCGRKIHMTKDDFIAKFGEEAYQNMDGANYGDKDAPQDLTPEQINKNKICVYEIWDKTNRKVVHCIKGMEDVLQEQDDPLQLRDFFPCPPPLMANPTTNKFLPVPDYKIAQDQYDDIDILYARIQLIVKAIKVAGVYAADSQTEINRMLQGQENVLIPVDNWAMFADRGGVKGLIDWYPVNEVAQVLTTLQSQYTALKSELFEVTGMSDIIRGASNQYETASAQKIKAQFASVRMNGYQRDVSYFVTHILRIMTEIMVQLYSDERLQEIVGVLSPEDMALAPQALQILRNDRLLSSKVDVQADSLTQSDWALEKESRMELLGNVSQYLSTAVQLGGQVKELAPMLLGLLKFAVSGFKGATEVEGMMDRALDQMIAAASQPTPPQPSPEEIKAQAEMQKMQAEMQLKQQEAQQRLQLEQQQAQADLTVQQQQAQLDAMLSQQKLEHQREMNQMELQFKQQMLMLELQAKQASAAIKMQQDQRTAEMKEEEHERKQAESSSKERAKD